MDIKMRGTDEFIITVNGELFNVSIDFAYPEQSLEPRWFVNRKDPIGWSELKSFDLADLNEALYFVNNFSEDA